MLSEDIDDLRVIFISQREAENAIGNKDIAVLSITDGGCDATIDSSFGHIYRYEFVDGSYDEDTIRLIGKNHSVVFQSYFDKKRAMLMKDNIASLISQDYRKILVHCHAGRSRSAAVAAYISATYSFNAYSCIEALHQSKAELSFTEKATFPHENFLVRRLLDNPNYYEGVFREVNNQSAAGSSDNTGDRPSFFYRLARLLF